MKSEYSHLSKQTLKAVQDAQFLSKSKADISKEKTKSEMLANDLENLCLKEENIDQRIE